jgi:hypothetical protein
MNLFTRQEQTDVCVLLDIGNASVTGSLVLFTKHQKPIALHTITIPLSIGERPHAEKLETLVIQEIENVLIELSHVGFLHPYFTHNSRKIERVLCTFSSPWYTSKTKNISISNEKKFVLTQHFMSDVLDTEIQLFKTELKNGTHGEEFSQGITLLTSSIVDTKINGYSLKNPLGAVTKQLDMTIYIGIGLESIVTALTQSIQKHFHTDSAHIIHHTFPLIAHAALQTIYQNNASYLLCNITGEVTDITRISQGTIEETNTFPSGVFFIIRKIAHEYQIQPEIAESYLHMYLSEKLDMQTVETLEKIMNDVSQEWLVYFKESISAHTGDNKPLKIYITADPAIAPLFIYFLTKIPEVTSDVIHISETVCSNFFTSPKHIVFNECIALEAIFLSSIQ